MVDQLALDTLAALRQGYAADFLGVHVPVPASSAPVQQLDYTHFTVQLRADRRLAALTAVNVDGKQLRDVPREGDDWRFDDRAPREAQAGEELYKRNDLDRGHLVRRLDLVWGDRATAEQANADTFHYTNAAPQASKFNQGKELWLGLENYVLEHADAHEMRLSVFTGPVLAQFDPVYRGVQVPLRFWKIAAWAGRDGLATTGYLLDQSPTLPDLSRARRRDADDPPPLGAYRLFQVPIEDLGVISGLALDQLSSADRFAPSTGMQITAMAQRWRRLDDPGDLVL